MSGADCRLVLGEVKRLARAGTLTRPTPSARVSTITLACGATPMIGNSLEILPDSSAEWLLTPEELSALRSARRLFVLGFVATGGLALGAAATTPPIGGATPGSSVLLVAWALAGVSLAAGGAWWFVRGRLV